MHQAAAPLRAAEEQNLFLNVRDQLQETHTLADRPRARRLHQRRSAAQAVRCRLMPSNIQDVSLRETSGFSPRRRPESSKESKARGKVLNWDGRHTHELEGLGKTAHLAGLPALRAQQPAQL